MAVNRVPDSRSRNVAVYLLVLHAGRLSLRRRASSDHSGTLLQPRVGNLPTAFAAGQLPRERVATGYRGVLRGKPGSRKPENRGQTERSLDSIDDRKGVRYV